MIPGGMGLAFHSARRDKEVWPAEERNALVKAERAAMSGADVQAIETSSMIQD